MKTSIFDMNFTLPPMIEMVKEEKEMMALPLERTSVWMMGFSPNC